MIIVATNRRHSEYRYGIAQAAEIAEIRAILVHAISDQAKRFYEKHGFTSSHEDPMTLMITIKEVARILAKTTAE